jgi:hypothetical protein
LRTYFQIIGDAEGQIEDELDFRFIALEREARRIRGTLTIEWGDGTSTVVEDFVKEATRSHAYEEAGDYEVTGTLAPEDGSKPKARSHPIVVSDTVGIDLSTAIIAANSDRNIANFKVTSEVTRATISRSLICVFHTKAGKWPVRGGLEGNPWVAAMVDGKLHAGTYEWLRPGQICKGITAGNIGPHVKHGALARWRPKKGERIWLFVSTHARLGVSSSNERSNLIEVIWPY